MFDRTVLARFDVSGSPSHLQIARSGGATSTRPNTAPQWAVLTLTPSDIPLIDNISLICTYTTISALQLSGQNNADSDAGEIFTIFAC